MCDFFRIECCLEMPLLMVFFLRTDEERKSLTVTRRLCCLFVVCGVTYEPGPGIWIRICNYFLYGFRKRLSGPLDSAARPRERPGPARCTGNNGVLNVLLH